MAYITTDAVKTIREEIKSKYLSKDGWKISVQRKDYNTVNVVIKQAPFNMFNNGNMTNLDLSYNRNFDYITNKAVQVINTIFNIVNKENFDNSHPEIDHFCVGFYSHIYIGTYTEPFKVYNKNEPKPLKNKNKKVEKPFKPGSTSIKSLVCKEMAIEKCNVSVVKHKIAWSVHYIITIYHKASIADQWDISVPTYWKRFNKIEHDEFINSWINTVLKTDEQLNTKLLSNKMKIFIED